MIQKTTFLLTCMLIAFSKCVLCYGQIQKDTIPINKCDQITVLISDIGEEDLYKYVGQKLIEAGYTVGSANKDFGSITTTENISYKRRFNYFLNVNIIKSTVRINGMYKMVPGLNGLAPENGIQKITSTTAPFLADYKSLFQKMDDFAKLLGGKITYEIRTK
ncbi:hypothetical protein [Flectobacillus longus]|uniref:hypothetical protein n=1 Tax=Flectobacillus longus TaxID=2984207 RepID=UPI0024B6476D|nr:hypothetical protein [Flectobacillus longus]MDI9881660.1 hypothetical protein [Flectobacillus longus]